MNLPLPGLGRRWRHGTLAVALAAAFLLSIFALSTGTAEANASPRGFGSSSGNVETCMTIRGTGLHIDLAVAEQRAPAAGQDCGHPTSLGGEALVSHGVHRSMDP